MSLYTSNENAFEYDGNPMTAVLQARALKNNGPLVVASDHRLVAMLPSALNLVTYAPKVGVALADWNAMFMPGVLFGPDVAENGIHLWVKPARCARYIKDLDDSGFDWTPIAGEAKDTATGKSAPPRARTNCM